MSVRDTVSYSQQGPDDERCHASGPGHANYWATSNWKRTVTAMATGSKVLHPGHNFFYDKREEILVPQ